MSWKTSRLSDLCSDVYSGGTPTSNNAAYYGGDIPWLRTQEVTFNRIRETELAITEAGYENSAAKWVPAKSVIVAMYGNSAGRSAVSEIPLTTNQACCNLVIDPARADYRFVFYALLLRYEELKGLAKGAAQNNLNASQVKGFEVSIPPRVEEQQRIADSLSAYDDLIENNRRRIALLEQSARLLYREWFVHLRFPGHEHVKIVDGVPEGWDRKRLIDLADMTMGQSPASDHYNKDLIGFPFHQGVSNFGERFVEHETWCDVRGRMAAPGDILFSVRAPVGRLNLTRDELVLGRGLAAMRSRAGQQSMLFYQLAIHFFKEDMIGGGAIFASVTKKDLENQLLMCPTSDLEKYFNDFASEVDAQIATLTRQIENLRQARDLLLPRLMSGEVTV